MNIYSLTSTNMSGVGGPMGSEHTDTNYIRYFSTKEYAKAYAEEEYGKKIRWWNDRSGGCTSGDLSYVMYDIAKVQITK